MCFLGILVVLGLDLGQISFNLVENAFATQQLALLASFYDLLAQACAAIKILRPTSLGFSIFEFFSLPFLSLSFLFVAVIGLLLGLLALKKN